MTKPSSPTPWCCSNACIPDGQVTLLMAHSDGMSWIERLGMLRAAERIEGNDWEQVGETD